MRKLSLSEIGNLAETIAAIGVIVSLVYLAVQIEQNTKAVRAASYQEVANGVTNFQSQLAQNESLSKVYIKGLENPEQLS